MSPASRSAAKPSVVVVADAPSPHQNVFFDAISDLGEVELEVIFCRRVFPGRAWSGEGPRRAHHRFPAEFRVGSIPLSPSVTSRIVADPKALPFVIGYYLPPMLATGLFLGAAHRKWVFWTDTLEPQSKARPLARRVLGDFSRRWFLERATACLSTGERGRDALIANGVTPERAFEIPFVVDQGWIKSSVARERGRREEIRARLRIPAEATVLLFVGQIIRRKGIDLLFEALRRIPTGATELHVLIVGDGPEKAGLEILANDLRHPVHFLPNQDISKLPALWAAADVFVLPSRFDAWPVVVVEALTAGLPVLGSNSCGSVVDRVEDDRTGWIFPAEDVAALADKLAAVVRLTKSQLRELGAAGQAQMDRYSPRAMAARFTEVTRRTLDL